MIRYAARYYKGKDGSEMVEVPAFDALTQGETAEEVRVMARDLVGSLISARTWGEGEDSPPPDKSLPKGDGWEWVYPEVF